MGSPIASSRCSTCPTMQVASCATAASRTPARRHSISSIRTSSSWQARCPRCSSRTAGRGYAYRSTPDSTWRHPILLPLCGLANLTGHGPPTVRADGMCLLGLSTTSADGWTNRPLVYASPDGIGWQFLSFVTPAIEGGSAVSDRAGPHHLRRDPAFLHAASRAARRPHPRVGPVPARRDRRHVDRRIRKRRRGADVAIPLARQRLGRTRRHRRDARWPHRVRLRLSACASGHSRARQRGRGPPLGSRAHPARRRRQLGPGLPPRDRDRDLESSSPSTT